MDEGVGELERVLGEFTGVARFDDRGRIIDKPKHLHHATEWGLQIRAYLAHAEPAEIQLTSKPIGPTPEAGQQTFMCRQTWDERGVESHGRWSFDFDRI